MTSPIVRSFLERSEKSPLGLFGLDTPSGGDRASLKRDLADGKRILLRRPTVYEIRSIDKKAREVEVVASTSGVKRDGNAIFHNEKAWDFRNFEKNPAMLWSHDYGSAFAPPGLPLGYWKTWGIDKTKAGNALVMRGWFEEDEFPEKVWRRILSGTIRAVSIGWNPIEFEELEDEKGRQVGWNFTLNELYECSWVVIGADPDAGVRGMYADLNEAELDVIANGRRAHELSRGVAYMLDHRDAPEEFLRSIVNLPKEFEMEAAAQPEHTITSPAAPHVHGVATVAGGPATYYLHTIQPVDHGQTLSHKHDASQIIAPAILDLGAPFRAVSDAIVTRDALESMEHAAPDAEIDAGLRACGIDDYYLPQARALVLRVGKKMASKRLTKLKGCRSGLDEVIAECEQEENCPEEMPGDMEAAATPEVAHEAAPEVPAIDPNEALRDLSEKLVRTVEQEKQRRYVSEVLGDLTSKLEALVS